MYAEFIGDGARPNDVSIAGESKRFWDYVWSVGKGYNQETE